MGMLIIGDGISISHNIGTILPTFDISTLANEILAGWPIIRAKANGPEVILNAIHQQA